MAPRTGVIYSAWLPSAPPGCRLRPLGPQAFYEKVLRNGNLQKFPRGENFCWHAAYDLHRFVEGYHAFSDTAWLDCGVRYYEFLVGKMDVGPRWLPRLDRPLRIRRECGATSTWATLSC